MRTYQETKDLYLKGLNKEYKSLNVVEKAVLADLMEDGLRGRCSPLLGVDWNELHKFLGWVSSVGKPYWELSDSERWAVEDAYFDRV